MPLFKFFCQSIWNDKLKLFWKSSSDIKCVVKNGNVWKIASQLLSTKILSLCFCFEKTRKLKSLVFVRRKRNKNVYESALSSWLSTLTARTLTRKKLQSISSTFDIHRWHRKNRNLRKVGTFEKTQKIFLSVERQIVFVKIPVFDIKVEISVFEIVDAVPAA